MSVRSEGIAASGIVALVMLAPDAFAERKSAAHIETATTRSAGLLDEARSRSNREEVELDFGELMVRDAELFRSAFNGSPVRRRANARRRHMRTRKLDDRRLQKSLRVFRRTQHGVFDRAIARESERWALDPFLFKGLLINESKLDPDLKGGRLYEGKGKHRRAVGGGARGIAQFTNSGVSAVNETRQRRHYWGERVTAFRRKDVWDADRAIAASAELLASYIQRFGRDGGVTAYNAGPYGGRLVKKHGFYRARASGKLSRVRGTRLQGHRFLLNVLRKTNILRRGAGLAPLLKPGAARRKAPRRVRRSLESAS